MTEADEMNAPADGMIDESDPRPTVRLPREGLPGAAIAGLACIMAVGLFLVINDRRLNTANEGGGTTVNTGLVTSPPLLDVPQFANEAPRGYILEAEPLPMPNSTPVRLQPIAPSAPPEPRASLGSPLIPPPPTFVAQPPFVPTPPPTVARDDEPALIIDGGAPIARSTQGAPSGEQSGRAAGVATAAVDQSPPPIRPKRIASRSLVVAAGTLIPAVLETPIDTARPGMVRAIVSRDARGFDGRRVLIPRASRLVGEYQADVRTGQNRVLVTWNTLVLPDGTQVELKSPAADALGGAGIPGKVHSYFLARFASALLQTAMVVGTNLATRSTGNDSIIVALPATQAGSMLGQELFPRDGYKPKITVRQGAAIKVFVAHDLDFSATSGHRGAEE